MLKALCLLLLVLLLPACKGATAQISAPDTQADIYTAVILRLYGVEHGVIPNSFPVLYIAQTLDNHAVLDIALQNAIARRLTPLPTRIIWVRTSQDVPWEPDGVVVKDSGAGISLGAVRPQKDGTVQVNASIVSANLAAYGATFVLEQRNGVWTVTGTTGPQWIS